MSNSHPGAEARRAKWVVYSEWEGWRTLAPLLIAVAVSIHSVHAGRWRWIELSSKYVISPSDVIGWFHVPWIKHVIHLPQMGAVV